MQEYLLSEAEEKVMIFLWEQDRPLSVLEMLEAWENVGGKSWTDNYMRAIVRSLEDKGALEFHDLDHRGSRYARRFRPTFSKREYFTYLAKRSGVKVSEMVEVEAVAMAQKGDREGMQALIHELEAIIEEYRTRGEDAR